MTTTILYLFYSMCSMQFHPTIIVLQKVEKSISDCSDFAKKINKFKKSTSIRRTLSFSIFFYYQKKEREIDKTFEKKIKRNYSYYMFPQSLQKGWPDCTFCFASYNNICPSKFQFNKDSHSPPQDYRSHLITFQVFGEKKKKKKKKERHSMSLSLKTVELAIC